MTVTVQDDGGVEVTLTTTGLVVGTEYTGFVFDGVNERPLYSGVQGQGRTLLAASTTTMTAVMPPLPSGGPYDVRLYVSGVLTKTISNHVFVVNRVHRSKTFDVRQMFTDKMAAGVPSLDLVPFLPRTPSIAALSNQTFPLNIAITPLTPSVTDPDDAVSYYAVVGSLPDGLTIDEDTGVISGTPTTPATEALRVRAYLTLGGYVQTASFNVVVVGLPTGSYADQTLGKDLAATITPTLSNPGGLTLTFSIIAGSLPAGLSLNASTGVITGTPTASGTNSGITIKIHTIAGDVTLVAFSITVFGLPQPNNYYTFEPATISGATVNDVGSGATGGPVAITSDGGSTPVIAGLNGNSYNANGTKMLRHTSGAQFSPHVLGLTLLGVVKVSAFGSTQYLFIGHEDANGGFNHSLISLGINASGTPGIFWRGADNVGFSLNGPVAMSLNAEHTLGLTYDTSTFRLDLYLDGVSVAHTTVNNTSIAFSAGASLGGRKDTNADFIQGKLDEVATHYLPLTPTQMAYAHARLQAGVHLF